MPEEKKTEEKKAEKSAFQLEQDERWAKAEKMMQEIRPGYRLSIHRVRPSWCSGFLERIDCTEEDPVDLDYLVNEWGGEVLRLRLCDDTGTYKRGSDLVLRSYPPRFQGQIIHREDRFAEQTGKRQNPDPGPQTIPLPQPSQQLDIVGILGLLQKTRKEDLTTLRALLGTATPPTPAIPESRSSLDDLLEFAEKWKQLQKLFGTEQPVPVSDDAGLLGSVSEIVKALSSQSKSAPNPAAAGRVVSPRAPNKPRAPRESSQDSDVGISDQISQLSVDKFSDLLLTSLAKMPEDRRAVVIQRFAAQAGLVVDDEPGDYDEEEDEEYAESDSSIGRTDA